jgi:tRNA-dihydrouridine synthase A
MPDRSAELVSPTSARPFRTVDDSHRLCVAPMMEWTDRHCRAFHRLLAPSARLYTEMITTDALLHGPRERLLAYAPEEHPVALQLGGSDPHALAACARLGAAHGYDEINFNLGCPSDRVQEARIGACLMKDPSHAAECVRAMAEAVTVPVTVKCRLGVDDHDDYGTLATLVERTSAAGAGTFIVHARMAILTGLTPAQNRSVPPLDYTRVYRLKADFPQLGVVVNGGIATLEATLAHARALDGVMLGRAAYHEPWLLARAAHALFGSPLPDSMHDVLWALLPHIERHLAEGGRLHDVTRHLLGAFSGLPGARRFRRHLSEHAHRPGADVDVLQSAMRWVETSDVQARVAGV